MGGLAVPAVPGSLIVVCLAVFDLELEWAQNGCHVCALDFASSLDHDTKMGCQLCGVDFNLQFGLFNPQLLAQELNCMRQIVVFECQFG
jgi:hypothetical protein